MMGPHLVWAFVVLCGFALVAWMWWRFTRAAGAWDAIERLDVVTAKAVDHAAALSNRIDTLEADLKPIKQKVNNSEFGKLGGAR